MTRWPWALQIPLQGPPPCFRFSHGTDNSSAVPMPVCPSRLPLWSPGAMGQQPLLAQELPKDTAVTVVSGMWALPGQPLSAGRCIPMECLVKRGLSSLGKRGTFPAFLFGALSMTAWYVPDNWARSELWGTSRAGSTQVNMKYQV